MNNIIDFYKYKYKNLDELERKRLKLIASFVRIEKLYSELKNISSNTTKDLKKNDDKKERQ